MLFNSVEYLMLLTAVLAAYGVAPAGLRKWVLIAGCVVFYVWWSSEQFLLLIALTAVNYFFVYMGTERPRWKRLLYISAVVINLGCIGFFKYYNFFAAAAAQGLGAAGMKFEPPRFDIVLPLGISFYTFHLMSYTIDVNRGEFEPRRSFSEFFLFGAFFPSLIAGPILRAREFFGQPLYEKPGRADVDAGVRLILLGMFQKMVLADSLSVFADQVFGNAASQTAWTAAFGAYAYTFQIYFDFSGYTLIALGSARLFGIKLPPNFAAPYTAPNIAVFWRRWHMTLSRWMRDYLYISLGGSRVGLPRLLFNLFVTMALVGLWHGASWTFVIWGVYHGMLLMAYNLYARTAVGRRVGGALGRLPAARAIGVALTFNLVAAGWIIFRAVSVSDAMAIAKAIWGLAGDPVAAAEAYLRSTFVVAAGLYSVYSMLTARGVDIVSRLSVRRRILLYILITFAIVCFQPNLKRIPFIYFQF